MIEMLESRRLLDNVPGPTSVEIGDTRYYAYSDGVNGSALWKSNLDGSNAVMVKDVSPSTTSNQILDWFFNYNGLLLFTANVSNMGGDELWRSDGTADGTYLVKNIYGG